MAAIKGAIWRMLDERMSYEPLPMGLDAAWDRAVGLAGKFVPRRKKLLQQAERILAFEKEYSKLTDARLHQAALDMRDIFRCNRDGPLELERAFALVREVGSRQIGEKAFPVQIAGALVLNAGCVAEMATGEGKTLTATMPVTIAGWRGRGCHVITVNDYLARRDAEWMGRIYRFCGLTVSFIEQQMPPEKRREAYMADITYCTNKEVTADFLRDRLVLSNSKGLCSTLLKEMVTTGKVTDRLVQRGLNFAVADEADSILVDEAVTPLIISGQAPNPEQIESFLQAADIAHQLQPETDYGINPRYREIELTEQGKANLAKFAGGLGGIWKGNRRRMELLTQALTAKELYLLGKHYVIDNDKIVIVDEFTGRMMPDRAWRDGLHQAVEAKEGVEVTPPKDTYARISFQRFFRMYRKLSGMTGTASEAGDEFWQIYHLPVVSIPTNRPCIRKNLPKVVLPNESAKWERIVQEIRRVHDVGRPILIGTRSVRASEQLSELLKTEKLEHQVLNAVYHKQEAQIVAQAGQHGKITVATNMAGRGTDIKLGRRVAQLGGLHVIAAEPNESARIDRQLYGRCARQGDPGSAQGIFSLDDEVVSRYAKSSIAYLRKRYSNSTGDISSLLVRSVFRLAQIKAERLALRQRKAVLRTDHWLDEQLGFTGGE
ncbi:MAG: preprotein translocase subunit SecA [Planctomycetota bacterium]|nr:MAG: preprotein translocase subunit SecA [Planctomycetota bacterium]